MASSLLSNQFIGFFKRKRLLVRLYHLLRNPRQIWRNASLRLEYNRKGYLPIPPGRLIFLVQGTDEADIFIYSGILGAQSLQEILEKNYLKLNRFHAILDFGCGAGRIIRSWKDLGGPQIFGVDIHPALIEWCRQNLPFAQFRVNKLNFRLEFDDNQFDFIYALSVFTHLSEASQSFWIAELTRLLQPGGYLLFSTHGDYYFPKYVLPDDRDRYSNGDLVVYGSDQEGSNLCVAYHPFVYVRDRLAGQLSLIDFIPQGAQGNLYQDLYLFQKPMETP